MKDGQLETFVPMTLRDTKFNAAKLPSPKQA